MKFQNSSRRDIKLIDFVGFSRSVSLVPLIHHHYRLEMRISE
jgi:hypothetical protein